MKVRALLVGFFVVTAAAFVAVPGFGEEDGPPDNPSEMDVAEFQRKWLELAMPTAQHQWFHFMCGSWTGGGTFWRRAEAPPIKMTGQVKSTLVMDGKFVRSKWNSTWNGMPFRAESTLGYHV